MNPKDTEWPFRLEPEREAPSNYTLYSTYSNLLAAGFEGSLLVLAPSDSAQRAEGNVMGG